MQSSGGGPADDSARTHAAARRGPVNDSPDARHDKYWPTSELKRLIRKRDRLLKLAKQTQIEANWTRWRNQRNLVTALNRRLRNEYMRGEVYKLLSEKQNLHKYHMTLRAIVGRKQNDSSPPLLANDGRYRTN